MKIVRVDQNTDEWRRARMGIPTASNFHLIITPLGKPVDSRERKTYMYRLVAERILCEPMPPRWEGNDHTERGIEMEPRAVSALEAKLGATLEDGGFVFSDNGRYGCSPDRLLMEPWSSVEVKCPAAWTHIQYMIEGPGDRYRPQVQGQILIGGFKEIHFWSYHPSFAPVYVRTLPNQAYIQKLSNLLDLFCDEVDAAEAWVRRHGNVAEIVREVSATS
jgi:hypothetical protein